MQQSEMKAAIEKIGLPYTDRRTHVYQVEIAGLEEMLLTLRGRILDDPTRKALIDGLKAQFPGLCIDDTALETVRRSPGQMLTVGTNLTSLHDNTSFLAEQISQMLNGAPVEVLWEQNNWSFVRQADGYLGWTYRPYLVEAPAPKQTHLVTAPVGLLRETPQPDAALVTRVLGGTAVSVRDISRDVSTEWAMVEMAGGWQGWLPAADLRSLGDLPASAGVRRAQLVQDASTLVGVPYQWGGCSAHGIDCSGFAQLLYRWIGITIPRDADMQCAAGQPLEPPFAAGDLLFFGEKGERRRITHVAVSLGGWRIIHSSRSRNGVQFDDVQAVAHLRESFLSAATFMGTAQE